MAIQYFRANNDRSTMMEQDSLSYEGKMGVIKTNEHKTEEELSSDRYIILSD